MVSHRWPRGSSCGGMKCRSRSSAVAQGFLCRCGCASSGTRRRVHHRGTVLSAQRLIGLFGSLSRLKQNVIGKATREDHGQLMNTMIRLYSGGKEAQQKQAMAFDLSAYDHQLITFAELFTTRFMALNVSMPLEHALDLGWQTLAECFEPHELLMKQALIEKYYPLKSPAAATGTPRQA